jgi:hypothetical protein
MMLIANGQPNVAMALSVRIRQIVSCRSMIAFVHQYVVKTASNVPAMNNVALMLAHIVVAGMESAESVQAIPMNVKQRMTAVESTCQGNERDA